MSSRPEHSEISKNELIVSIDTLTTNFLGGHSDPELVDSIIPTLVGHIASVVDVQLGGTGAEIGAELTDGDEYWSSKKQLRVLNSKISESIKPGPRSELILNSFKTLAEGEPDFDFYVSDPKSLTTIFESCKDLEISPNFRLVSSLEPIYSGSLYYRTLIKLVDNKEKCHFHIDITVLPNTGDDQAQNRRHFVDDVHDNCRGDLSIEDNQVKVKFDLDTLPKFNKPLSTKFSDKDIMTIPEIAARVIRKEITINNSKKNLNRSNFNHKYFFSLMDVNSVFAIRELTFGPNSRSIELFDRQKPSQKENFIKDCLLAGQKDPWQFIIFIQDTGLDSLLFDRHLTKREVLSLLSSEYLNFSPSNNNENLIQKVKQSRENYLNLDGDDPKKNGLARLISAFGQVLGDKKDIKDFEVHLQNGLDILSDPKNRVKPLQFPKSNYHPGSKKQEILEEINYGGGVTEKGLHHILNQKNPKRYPLKSETDKKNFDQTLFELKKTGLLEVARRIIRLPSGEEIDSLFYYPCFNPIEVSQITNETDKPKNDSTRQALGLLNINTVEATLSLTSKDVSYLKDSVFWDEIIALIGSESALNLVEWQLELIELQKEVVATGKIANYLDLPQVRAI